MAVDRISKAPGHDWTPLPSTTVLVSCNRRADGPSHGFHRSLCEEALTILVFSCFLLPVKVTFRQTTTVYESRTADHASKTVISGPVPVPGSTVSEKRILPRINQEQNLRRFAEYGILWK